MPWGWLLTIADSVVLIIVMRWAFRIGSPGRDWRTVSSVCGRIGRWVRGWRVHLRDLLGLTDDAWRRLREQYQAGKYGTEGT